MSLNPKTKLVAESLTLQLNTLANKLASEGRSIINLTAGELDFDTPAYIRRAVGASTKLNKYTPTAGMASLRQAIAKLVGKDYGWKVKPENVAVTAGAKQALHESLFAILKPGDEVIIPSPDWITYRYQVILNDAKPVIVPLDNDFDLDMAKLKKAITRKTKAIILNSPNNPTGTVYSNARLTALARLLKNKPIYLIADDVYGKIVYERGYKSPALFAPDKDFLILVNSFSKSQALTGWRIGYVVATPEIIGAINSYQSHTTGNAALPSQIAAQEIVESGDKTTGFVKTLRQRRELADRLLQTVPGISYLIPDGAFYYFIDVSEMETDTVKFCKGLLEAGLALVPGEAFGYPGFVRLSFSGSAEKLTKGIKILSRFCEEY